MNISDIRQKNLRALVHSKESIADFARMYDFDPTYISQLLNGHRNIGERSARNIEKKIGLKQGSLDLGDEQISLTIESQAEESKVTRSVDAALTAHFTTSSSADALIHKIAQLDSEGQLPEHASQAMLLFLDSLFGQDNDDEDIFKSIERHFETKK